jgi:rubrerythrin
MPKTCSKCGRIYRKDRKSDLCKPCDSVCHCGEPKDFRAAECVSCARRRSALAQWANKDSRAALHAGIVKSNIDRHVEYEGITIESFTYIRPCDNRHYARFWRGGRIHTVYRYQWVWQQAHGTIPHGMVVHHINENPADDRLENLALMKRREHAQHHNAGKDFFDKSKPAMVKPSWICRHCGKSFQKYKREGDRNKFCSKKCSYDHRFPSRIRAA